MEQISSDYPDSYFQIHNYFPVPHKPFVLNLASSDEVVSNKSIEHITKAIDRSASNGMKYFYFMQGFA